VVILLLVVVLVIGALGVYHGLQERNRLTLETAEEHYAAGLAHLENGEYELAVADGVRLPRHLGEAERS